MLKKRFFRKLSLLLLFFFTVGILLYSAQPLFAVENTRLNDIYHDTSAGEEPEDGGEDETGQPISSSQSSPSVIESLVAKPIEAINFALQKFFGYESIPKLFFAKDSNGKSIKDLEVGGVMSKDEWDKIVMPWFTAMQVIAWILMGITIIIQGWMIAGTGTLGKSSPELRAAVSERFKNWVIAAFMIAATPFIVDLIFDANMMFVETAYRYWGGKNMDSLVIEESVLMTAIVNLIFLFSMVWFNIRYLIRKIMVTFLVILAPLAAWSSTFQDRKIAFELWFTELLTNVFYQASNAWVFAILFGGVFKLQSELFDPQRWWVTIALVYAIIPLSNLITKLIANFFDLIGQPEDTIASNVTRGVSIFPWKSAALMGIGAALGFSRGGTAAGTASKFRGGSGGSGEIISGGRGGGVSGGGFSPSAPQSASGFSVGENSFEGQVAQNAQGSSFLTDLAARGINKGIDLGQRIGQRLPESVVAGGQRLLQSAGQAASVVSSVGSAVSPIARPLVKATAYAAFGGYDPTSNTFYGADSLNAAKNIAGSLYGSTRNVINRARELREQAAAAEESPSSFSYLRHSSFYRGGFRNNYSGYVDATRWR